MLDSIFRIPKERDFYKEQAESFAQIIASMKVAIRKQGENKTFCSEHCIYHRICNIRTFLVRIRGSRLA